MLVGLFDQDMMVDKAKFFPSLELMKYSSYYKQNQHIVHMLSSVADTTPYDKIIIHKSASKDNLPTALLQNPKVEWIGKSFYGGKLVLPPDEINLMPADKSIYESYIMKHLSEYGVRNGKFIKKMLENGTPLRLSFNGIPLFNKPPIVSGKYIFLYDEQLNLVNNLYTLLKPYQTKSIFVMKPQYFTNWDLFVKLHNDFTFLQFKNDESFIYNGPITNQQFVENFAIFSHKFRLGFSDIKPGVMQEGLIVKELLKKGNFFFYSLAHDRNLLFGCDKDLPPILFAFASYTFLTGKQSDITFKQYLLNRKRGVDKIGLQLEAKYPILYPIFNSCNKDVHKGGYWQL